MAVRNKVQGYRQNTVLRWKFVSVYLLNTVILYRTDLGASAVASGCI